MDLALILEKALLNTLLGMGTVFVVLIFISLLISCFKYISKLQDKFSKKAALEPTKAAPAPVTAAVEEEEETEDDLELVAVITAAVAASMGSSTDGFVVRSIKRASNRKW